MNIKSDKSTAVTMDSEKRLGLTGRQTSVATNASLDEALDQLEISTADADEAFDYLKVHPNADAVRQEAITILSDPKATRRLLRKIDLTIVPCMVAVYFLQYL